jgi:hypothetical protein
LRRVTSSFDRAANAALLVITRQAQTVSNVFMGQLLE